MLLVGNNFDYRHLRMDFRTISVITSPKNPICISCRLDIRLYSFCPLFLTKSWVVFFLIRYAKLPENRNPSNIFFHGKSFSFTCIASLLSWAFRRTDSISPTAKPMSKFMSKMGIRIINKLRIRNVGIEKGRVVFSSLW